MPLIRNTSDKPVRGGAAVEDWTTGLTSASADARWAAARSAADVPSSVAALARALSQESEMRVREAIFTALARFATLESALAVLPYIRSDDANLRTSALDAMRAMPQVTQSHLPQLLADPDPDVRLLACDLVRNIPGTDGPSLLCGLLDIERQANVCAAAVEVVTEIASASALPALSRCAARFPDDPFLGFAIKVAADRLRG